MPLAIPGLQPGLDVQGIGAPGKVFLQRALHAWPVFRMDEAVPDGGGAPWCKSVRIIPQTAPDALAAVRFTGVQVLLPETVGGAVQRLLQPLTLDGARGGLGEVQEPEQQAHENRDDDAEDCDDFAEVGAVETLH